MMGRAIPVVKPLVTGQGINLMRRPIPAKPMRTRMVPAIMVAINSPA